MARFSLNRLHRDSQFFTSFPDASFDNDIGIETPATSRISTHIPLNRNADDRAITVQSWNAKAIGRDLHWDECSLRVSARHG
jgi:hypothetical protein